MRIVQDAKMPIALPQETMTIMNAPIGDSNKKDIAHALHPYTNLAVHEDQGPLIISKGEGVYVWDDQGNRYLDCLLYTSDAADE